MEREIDKRRKREQRLAEQQERRGAYKDDIVNPKIRNASFKNFERRKGTEAVIEACKRFYREFEEREDGLMMFGGVGNGKSHLARAVQRYLDYDGYVTLFLDFPMLSELAKDTFGKSGISVADLIKSATAADLLVLDELGIAPLTTFEYKSLLFPILNGRAGKKTIITTNLDMNRLDRWLSEDKDGQTLDEDKRMMDRIIGGFEIVQNKGTSKRQEDRINANKGRG